MDLREYSLAWWEHRCKTKYTNRELNSKFVIVNEIGLALQNVYLPANKTSPHYILHISIDPTISTRETQEILDYLDIPRIWSSYVERAIANKQLSLVVMDNDNYHTLNTIEVYDNGLQVLDTCQFLISNLEAYYIDCLQFFEEYNGLVDGFEEYLKNYNYEQFKPKEYDFTAFNLFKLLSNVVESKRINDSMLDNGGRNYRNILSSIHNRNTIGFSEALYEYVYYQFDDERINEWLKSYYGFYTHLARQLLDLVPKSKLAMVTDIRLVEFIVDLSTVQLKIRDFLSKRDYTYSLYRFKWNEKKQRVDVTGTIGYYNY